MHVSEAIRAFTAWTSAYPWLFAAGAVLLIVAGLWWATWSAARSVRKSRDRALAAQARRARSLGLDLSYREADLLACLERRHSWWPGIRALSRKAR